MTRSLFRRPALIVLSAVAIQTLFVPQASPEPGAPGAPPTTKASWEGLFQEDTMPPDPTGAVSPNRYIQMVNSKIGIWTRDGRLLSSASLSTLTGDEDFLGDPQIIWDEATRRFYFVVLDVGRMGLLVGFSKGAAPSHIRGDWCSYNLDFGLGASLVDFPKLGDTKHFALIGVNAFNIEFEYLGAHVLWFSKPAGGELGSCPAAGALKRGRREALRNQDGSLAWTAVPADQAGPSGTGWVVATPDLRDSPNLRADYLSLFKVTRNPDGTARIQQRGTKVSVGTWTFPAEASQLGSTKKLETLDGRLLHAVVAVDPRIPGRPSRARPAVWTAHAVAGGAGSEVRWYEIDALASRTFQSGRVSDPDLFVFNPAISPDRAVRPGVGQAYGSSMVMTFNTSGLTEFPAIQMVSKVRGEPRSRIVMVRQSPGPYEAFDCTGANDVCRWGDYSGAVPDPAAPLSGGTGAVWLTNEWTSGVPSAVTAPWRTWIWKAKP